MKFLLTALGLVLFSQSIPPVFVFSQTMTSSERLFLLKNSTFNPALRGEDSERWDFEYSDEYKLEQSTFNPALRGEDSERWDFEYSDEYKLEHSTFNPEYGMNNTNFILRKTNPIPHIQREDFQSKIRLIKRPIRSIRLDISSIRLYPIRTSYRQRIMR